MRPTFNDKLIAYFTLFSGLAISAIAEYYSIMGLMAIYPTAIIPIVIMGIVLGIGKISGTVWLKQNWEWSPFFLKAYVLPAIVVLMLITSLGVFGFLSKAHSDQSLVSGDVISKIAVYDEKIKTAKENIDANRKALKQMDEAVDQVMGRSSDEKGADKAVALRRGQAKERTRLLKDIEAEQKTIAELNEVRAPIAAEVRKVEAEVGPIKYIAHLLYGENPDANILEKAVIWVTVLIVIVLDPLAVVLLLASQYSFQRFRKLEEEESVPVYVADVGEKPTAEELAEIDDPEVKEFFANARAVAQALDKGEELPEQVQKDVTIVETPVPVEQWNDWIAGAEAAIEEEKKLRTDPHTIGWMYHDVPPAPAPEIEEESILEKHPYLTQPFKHFENLTPMVAKSDEKEAEALVEQAAEETLQEIAQEENKILAMGVDVVERPGDYLTEQRTTFDFDTLHPEQQYVMIDGQMMSVKAARGLYEHKPAEERAQFTEVIEPEVKFGSYVQNEEQGEDTKWNRVISEAEYREQAQAKLNDGKNNTNNTP